jgi:hypothetical protein
MTYPNAAAPLDGGRHTSRESPTQGMQHLPYLRSGTAGVALLKTLSVRRRSARVRCRDCRGHVGFFDRAGTPLRVVVTYVRCRTQPDRRQGDDVQDDGLSVLARPPRRCAMPPFVSSRRVLPAFRQITPSMANSGAKPKCFRPARRVR